MMRRFFKVIVMLGLILPTLADPLGTPYTNSRFGYQVTVPDGLLISNRAADNSGLTWQTGTVKLQVSGINNPYGIKPHEYFERIKTAAADRIVTEREGGHPYSWYEILYTKDGRRIHQRTYVGGGSINTVAFSYPYRYRKQKERLGVEVLESFRPGDLSRAH